MFRARSLIVIALVLYSSATLAKELSYDYVDAGYVTTKGSGQYSAVKGHGYLVGASFSLSPIFIAGASFSKMDFDKIANISTDSTQYDFGVGVHKSIEENTDIVATLSYLHSKVNATDGVTTASNSDTGNSISLLVRSMVSNKFEFEAGASRTNFAGDISTAFGVGGGIYLTDTISMLGTYSNSSDADGYYIRLRYQYR